MEKAFETMALDKTSITKLLDLKTHSLISDDIVVRQTEVIRKAYSYLAASDSRQVIYIADEVGLGKTYIALGIAMLFRHFASGKTIHRDLVLVPKANLQNKWQDAARSFARINYIGDRNPEFLPFFQTELITDRLYSIVPDAAMKIFRMTSFSALATRSSSWERKSLLERLKNQVRHDPWAVGILEQAWNSPLFKLGYEKELLCLAAYLLNALSGRVNTLIVDEAHNYRHGIDAHASYRNLATGCFLGLLPEGGQKAFENDPREMVLAQFPELKQRVRPLANKVVCLSATPKDRDLWEISRQLDCFLHQHPLKGVHDVEEYHQRLKSFLIRGNMTYGINGAQISRHECRAEYREGHVSKSKKGEWLEVPDDFTGAFWQLIQYQSIKHLRAKGNTSFEMGMLAGFETYHLDAQKVRAPGNIAAEDHEEDEIDKKKEYEQTASDIRQSEDRQVIVTLIQDFLKKFDVPPHPKQTPLAVELLEQMLERQEKSLVFVRRVHTAAEFAGRLLRRYEQAVADDLRRFGGKVEDKLRYARAFWHIDSPRLADMLKEFDLKDIREDLMAFFRAGKLISKIRLQKGFEWFDSLDTHDDRVDFVFLPINITKK
ncbi:MAG: DEAD/DEAH box helicase family protein [Saprospiraceae bacterium]